MIEAIGEGGGVALATRGFRDARGGRRSPSRRPAAADAAERIESDDALAATGRDDAITAAPPSGTAPGTATVTATVTAIAVARRLVGAAARALPVQARLGPAAVRLLLRDAV